MTEPQAIKRHEPLVRIVRRAEMPAGRVALLAGLSLVLGILVGALFILLLGYNPAEVYAAIVKGAFRSKLAVQGTVKIAIPLLITSLGLSLAFKMKFWNIGGEGQIIMGAIAATYFGVFHGDWPHWLLLAAMLLAGMIGGGLWGLIPAFFKTRFGTNETLLTLMLNYIALYMIKFLREGPWRDPTSTAFPQIAMFGDNARLGNVFGVHAGWILALVLVALVFVYTERRRYRRRGLHRHHRGLAGPAESLCHRGGHRPVQYSGEGQQRHAEHLRPFLLRFPDPPGHHPVRGSGDGFLHPVHPGFP